MVLSPELLDRFGFRSGEPSLFTAAASMHLHANVLHLLANMLFLAAVGASVEIATGPLRFGLVYFLSGFAGVLAHFIAFRNAPDSAVLVGASGAVAGCAAYYAVRYHDLRVVVAPNRAFRLVAVCFAWVALQALGAVVRIGDPGGTAFWAHLGGFAMGLLLSAVFRSPDLGHLKLEHEVLRRMNERSPAAVQRAAEQLLEQRPQDPVALKQLAQSLQDQGEHQEEAEVRARLLDLVDADERARNLARLADLGELGRLPGLRRRQLADEVGGSHPELAIALLRSVAEGDPADPQRPEAMWELASLLYRDHPEAGHAVLEGFRAAYPLHPNLEQARAKGWLT